MNFIGVVHEWWVSLGREARVAVCFGGRLPLTGYEIDRAQGIHPDKEKQWL